MAFLILLLWSWFSSPILSAAETTVFSARQWTPGVHLLAGAGVNSGKFADHSLGAGLNLHTAIGYFLGNRAAVEGGSIINFNDDGDVLLWNSLFSLGLRFRLPAVDHSSDWAPYGRGFIGWGVTVAKFSADSTSLIPASLAGKRTQFDGPAGGLGLGVMRTWDEATGFIELTGTLQSFDEYALVQPNGELPIVLQSGLVSNSPVLWSLQLAIGLVAF